MSYDEYSDSDDDSYTSDIQTSVLLGLPDGPIPAVDLAKPTVSRIGGLPVFPRGILPPPVNISNCANCSQPMELLVQLWCPFEGSPFDRTLHIWGCARSRCRRKDGSVKAARVLRFNEKYAAKLAAKQAKIQAKAQTAIPPQSISNPFSVSSGAGDGFGAQLFGGGFGDDVPPTTAAPSDPSAEDDSDSSFDEEDDEPLAPSDVPALAAAFEETALVPTGWSSAPTYPSLYLDTTFEYIPPPTKANSKAKPGVQETKENQWGAEGYERTKGIDEVFEKFVSRVGHEGEQCVRYELSGQPLPFSTDSIYKKLFPIPPTAPGTHVVVTNSAPAPNKRAYDPSTIPACPRCGSARVFECQLMPNLVNVFRQTAPKKGEKKKQTDEERREEVARLLRGEPSTTESDGAKGDMEWGTCMVFSCVRDCCMKDGKETKEGWSEEAVVVQWDI